MTFQEIEQKLPNGFHDARIREINADFVDCSVSIGLDLLIGEPDTPNPEEYRAGTLRISQAYLFFLDPPDTTYKFIPNGVPINSYGALVKIGDNARIDRLRPALPTNTMVYRFFLEESNASLFLAGANVELSWDDGGLFEPINGIARKAT